ncbi:nitroreductase family protein [Candidatus Shapirobacteria bacterium]|nr:nitroreductase family protein [Candidatus Shapirobacteria bacterium]
MNQLLTALNWRYATKTFDPTKKISDSDLSDLLESVRLAPTSNGLQAFRLINVKDNSIRQQLLEATYNKSQLSTCSDLFIFVSLKTLTQEHLDKYIQNIQQTRNQSFDQILNYATHLQKIITDRSPHDQQTGFALQTYIGLGFLLLTSAIKQIDACPIGGFDASKFGEILGISNNEVVTVICPLGYRDTSDVYTTKAKVRRPVSEFYSIK